MVIALAAWATPFLHPPFTGDHRVSGVFDHGDARRPNDQRQLAQWGVWTYGRRGHAAYDWPMPVGTPVLAAADGVVAVAKDQGPTRCGKRRAKHDVRVAVHHRVGERHFTTWYLHLSKFAVKAGQRVTQGQVLGASGNTGCSSGPHLHFAVHHRTKRGPMFVDPYGWAGTGTDPLSGRRTSEWLWVHAPLLFREVRARREPDGPVGIGRVRAVVWKDGEHPNQEFVELRVREGRHKLVGHTVRNRSGERFELPRNAVATASKPYRLYSGKGENRRHFGFIGAVSGVWDDTGDCAYLEGPNGENLHRVLLGPPDLGLCR